MTPDLDRIGAAVNTLWDTWSGWLIAGAIAATLALTVLSLLAWWRSADRARALSRITALVVLAWTSEGLWEVARDTLNLPVAFAVMTFFVFEAMMLTAAMHAEQHRARYGTPGPAGRYVWVLACTTATVVGLNADSVVGVVLRASLPLASVGLWWVISMRTPRDTDTPDIVAAREAEAARRTATWTITPATVLVWVGLRRPGQQTMTQAERDRRIRRMVVAADRLHAAKDGSLTARRQATRLRRLARQATDEDVTEVRDQVERTTSIVDLVMPVMTDVGAPNWPAIEAQLSGQMSGQTADNPSAKTRGLAGQNAGQTAQRGRTDRPDVAGQNWTDKRRRNAERAADILDRQPDISGAELAKRLRLSARSGQRARSDAAILTGQQPAKPSDTPGDFDRPSPNGHTDISPDKVAAMVGLD